jgi:hypothetical protein
MGGGASIESAQVAAASPDDVAGALAGLGEAERAKILAALKAPSSGAVADNAAHVKENAGKIYELSSVVMGNKQKIYAERAFIEENRHLILKNYSAAAHGNRLMANQNTDDIFINRRNLLRSVKAVDAVQENFVKSKINESKIDFLEHRAKMNGRVVAVNEKMAQINALLIEVNSSIMEGNAEIVAFNSTHIEANRKLLDGETWESLKAATPETNLERINANTQRIVELTTQAQENSAKHDEVLAAAKENRAKVLANADVIYERRADIEANHAKILENSAKVAALITGS